MSSLGRFLGGTLLFGTLGLVACAQGTTDVDPNAGKSTKTTKEPTEPEEPSVKVPSGSSSGQTDPEPEPEPDPDPGASSSGGSSGGSSSGGTSTSSSGGTSTSSSGGSSSGATSSSGGSTSSSGGVSSCVTTAPSNACGLSPQCGCAANETCDITNKSTGAVSCTLAGGGPLASLCTTSSQCAKGFTCAYGACRPYCSTLNTACSGTPGTGMCTELYENNAAVPNGKVCTINCDLRNPSAVCGSNNCIYDASVNAADCDKAGGKALYDACSSYNECGQGLACVNHPFYGPECEKWCRVGMDSDCGLFEVCEDVYGASAPVQGGYSLGHCQ